MRHCAAADALWRPARSRGGGSHFETHATHFEEARSRGCHLHRTRARIRNPISHCLPVSTLSPTEQLELRPSTVHGTGAFALRSLSPGQVVGQYEGRRYTAAEASKRDWDDNLTYVFGLSDGTVIDGNDGGNATRHINHSCAPNCQAVEEEADDGQLVIVIRTRRRIRAGDELFIDYRLDVGGDDPAAYRCRCGAPRCRGTLAAVEKKKLVAA